VNAVVTFEANIINVPNTNVPSVGIQDINTPNVDIATSEKNIQLNQDSEKDISLHKIENASSKNAKVEDDNTEKMLSEKTKAVEEQPIETQEKVKK